MKIVIGTSTPFHLIHIARELAEYGNDVTVIGYMPKWKMKKYNLGKAKYKSLFWYCPPLFLLALQHYFPNFQRKIVFKIMNFVDILISFKLESCDYYIGLSGISVKSLAVAKNKYNAICILERGSAHVMTQNSLISESNKCTLPLEYIERELKGYELADFISIPSIFVKNSFLNEGVKLNKLFINNYGVNLERFNRKGNILGKVKKEMITLLFVGGWSYQKGVDVLFDTLKLKKNLQIIHIGSNGGYKFPESNRFKSLGHIDNRKLIEYYNMYDFLILPSRQDGFGMVLLEALSSGMPIIASKNTGALDIYDKISNKNSIEILDDLTAESIVKSIEELSKFDFSKKEVFSVKDKEYFTWKEYGKRYNQFLKELRK